MQKGVDNDETFVTGIYLLCQSLLRFCRRKECRQMDYEQLGHILESIHPGVTIADSSGVFRFVSNSYLSGRSVKGSVISSISSRSFLF